MLLKRKIPVWFIAKKVWFETLVLLAATTAIYALQHTGLLSRFSLPMSLLTVLGTAISLVLAFRTNQSYERWWEARSVWGGIVNDSRTLIRQLITFTRDGAHRADNVHLRTIALRHIAWCYCLGRSLRGLDPLAGLDAYVNSDELNAMASADNKPNALLLHHARDIRALHRAGAVDSFDAMQLDNTLARLCDHMGKCERIKTTVFPSTYSLFIHSFIYLFILAIPFGLGPQFGVSEIPLATGIGVAFFLIEKTAMHMQDPFENRPTDTAVTTIATTIHRNILQMLGDTSGIPDKHPAGPFYVM